MWADLQAGRLLKVSPSIIPLFLCIVESKQDISEDDPVREPQKGSPRGKVRVGEQERGTFFFEKLH